LTVAKSENGRKFQTGVTAGLFCLPRQQGEATLSNFILLLKEKIINFKQHWFRAEPLTGTNTLQRIPKFMDNKSLKYGFQ